MVNSNVLGDVDAEELKTCDSVSCSPVDVDRGLLPPLLPEGVLNLPLH